jgi:hypothetical protein
LKPSRCHSNVFAVMASSSPTANSHATQSAAPYEGAKFPALLGGR